MKPMVPTETITVNRGDWSGRLMTIEIDRPNMLFTLPDHRDDVFGLLGVPGAEGEVLRVYHNGEITDLKVFSMAPEGEWVASDYCGDITREHSDPIVAAAMVLCMTM